MSSVRQILILLLAVSILIGATRSEDISAIEIVAVELTTLAQAQNLTDSNNANIIYLEDGGFAPYETAITTGATVTWFNDTNTTHTLIYQTENEPPNDFILFLPYLETDSQRTPSLTPPSASNHNPETISLSPGESFSYTYSAVGDYSFSLQGIPEYQGTVLVRNEPSSVQMLPIGNRTAGLGQTSRFVVKALAPDNNSVSFEISPLPLLDNMRFNATNGLFEFTPSPEQIGSYELTFTG